MVDKMKRGRPPMRHDIHKEVIRILSDGDTPKTTSVLTKELSQVLNKRLSWNTVDKYVQELVQVGRVQPIELPHSKDDQKSGLTVYTLKK